MTVAAVGKLVALTTTGTDAPVFIVVSGKLNGLAFTVNPLIVSTLMVGGGTVGRFKEKGSDLITGPLLFLVSKVREFASSRNKPLSGAVHPAQPPC